MLPPSGSSLLQFGGLSNDAYNTVAAVAAAVEARPELARHVNVQLLLSDADDLLFALLLATDAERARALGYDAAAVAKRVSLCELATDKAAALSNQLAVAVAEMGARGLPTTGVVAIFAEPLAGRVCGGGSGGVLDYWPWFAVGGVVLAVLRLGSTL